jgi:predicted nucleic acid-binding protein
MSVPPLILDADGLDALSERRPPDRLRALLGEALKRGGEVLVPAVVCAECCRGLGRTRAVETALSGRSHGRGGLPAVRVVPTDFDLACRVGAVLHAAGAATSEMVDAHAVAVASLHGGGIVVTSDGDDVERLALTLPGVRVVTRPAR